MSRGRPTKYDPAYCVKVKDLMMQGASKVEVAYHFGVHTDTIQEWEKVHPDFSVAIKEGVSLSEGWWQMQARKSLENQKFNSTLWYMNMKNRFGWSDKQETREVKDFSYSEKIESARKRLEKVNDSTSS